MAELPKWNFFQSVREPRLKQFESELEKERQAAYIQALTTAHLAELSGEKDIERRAKIKAITLANPGITPEQAEAIWGKQEQAKPVAEALQNQRTTAMLQGEQPTWEQQGLLTGQRANTSLESQIAGDIANTNEARERGIGGVKATAARNRALTSTADRLAQSEDLWKGFDTGLIPKQAMMQDKQSTKALTELGSTIPRAGEAASAAQNQAITSANLGAAKDIFGESALAAQSPITAGLASEAANKAAISSANLQASHPELQYPGLLTPMLMQPGQRLTDLQRALMINAKTNNVARPMAAPTQSTVINRRDLGALD